MKKILLLLLLVVLTLPGTLVNAQGERAVVRAVLFYSPTCPHCHQVIDEVLPPLAEQYGEQLYMLMIDTSKEAGGRLYQSMVSSYGIPRERMGVPALVMDDVLLVGSVEIPQRFPDLIEAGLAGSGIDWPDFSGFDPAAAEAVFIGNESEPATGEGNGETNAEPAAESDGGPVKDPEAQGVPSEAEAGAETLVDGTVVAEASPDPVAFVLAAIITLLMLGALGYVAGHLRGLHFRLQQLREGPARSGLIPALLVVGLAVALYLSYVEINQVAAVCGPVGECNVVQSSPYAQIGGIPVAVLGIVYYIVVGVLWLGQYALEGVRLRVATATLLGVTVAGTLFSVYLTLLEIFVIEAVCAWCLTSAAVSTLLMLVVAMLIIVRVPLPESEMALPGVP